VGHDITHNGSIVNVLMPMGRRGLFGCRCLSREDSTHYEYRRGRRRHSVDWLSTPIDAGAGIVDMLFAGDDAWTGVAGSMDLDVRTRWRWTLPGLVPDPGWVR
jgi:hypothetical protein